jgi:hypothetical protein
MIKSALSNAVRTADAIDELAGVFKGVDPTLVVIFFSSRYPAGEVASLARAAWPNARTIGCSTSGEIVTGAMADGCMSAMVIDKTTVPLVEIAIVDDMSNLATVNAACQSLGDILYADHETHVGLVLMDGMSGKEEIVMDRLGDLSDLRFIGGSAGDDLAFKASHVFADGVALQNAAVLAVMHVPAGYRIIKTQSFCRTGKSLTPTKVNAEKREVVEFDGKPASQAYMEAVGVSSLDDAARHFMSNPVGLMNGDDPYVRSPQAFDGQALKFYCAVSAGVDLELLQSTDIIADTRSALADANRDGKVIGLLNFNCILRTLELKSRNKTADYGALFTIPTAGFSTYGEADIGHINQTATMVAFLG